MSASTEQQLRDALQNMLDTLLSGDSWRPGALDDAITNARKALCLPDTSDDTQFPPVQLAHAQLKAWITTVRNRNFPWNNLTAGRRILWQETLARFLYTKEDEI